MPITRSGREVAAASVVIGIDDVLEARIACAGSTSSAARNSSSFASTSSTIASIIRSAGASAEVSLTRPSTSAADAPPFASSFSRLFCIAGEAALDRARERVVEQHLPPGGGDDLGDAGTHLTGTDDEDALEAHRRSHQRRLDRGRVFEPSGSSRRAPLPRMTTPIRSLIALPFGLSTPASTTPGSVMPQRVVNHVAVRAVHQDPGGGVLGDHLAAVLGLDRDAHADRARRGRPSPPGRSRSGRAAAARRHRRSG